MQDKITKEDELSIISAIESAEKNTSGEIRVHIESHCTIEPLDRAAELFAQLHMHKTEERNGILFYIAIKSHHFAIIGDVGINSKVPPNFWDNIRDLVLSYFKEGNYAEGISKGVRMAGEKLKQYFPYNEENDQNELDNQISFGD